MANTGPIVNCAAGTAPAAEMPQASWHVVYTCAQHERRVAQAFQHREIEHFLPLYSSRRQWKDRRVQIAAPLFPGYVFVRLKRFEWLRALQVPGVVRLVSFNGQPATLPEEDLHVLKCAPVTAGLAEPYPYLPVGQGVRIRQGSLAGLEGLVVRRKNRLRFVLSVHLIGRSVAVEIDPVDLEPAGRGWPPR